MSLNGIGEVSDRASELQTAGVYEACFAVESPAGVGARNRSMESRIDLVVMKS